MTSTAAFWDKIAPKYAKDPIKDMAGYKAGLDRIRPLLLSKNVLELGCGTGMTAVELAPSAASYLATDVSQGMIDQCHNRGAVDGLTFAVGTSADTQDAAYDVVLALNLIHLIENQPQAYRDIHRALKPGGVFISKTIVQPDSVIRLKHRAMMAAAKVYQWINPSLKLRMVAQKVMLAEMTDAGFKIIGADLMGDRAFVVAEKQ